MMSLLARLANGKMSKIERRARAKARPSVDPMHRSYVVKTASGIHAVAELILDL